MSFERSDQYQASDPQPQAAKYIRKRMNDRTQDSPNAPCRCSSTWTDRNFSEAFEEFKKASQLNDSPPIMGYRGYTLAECDLAFEWLRIACEDRDKFLQWSLETDPRLDVLRSDQRYVQSMKTGWAHKLVVVQFASLSFWERSG